MPGEESATRVIPTVTALGKALAACAAADEWDGEKAQEWWAEVTSEGDGARLRNRDRCREFSRTTGRMR